MVLTGVVFLCQHGGDSFYVELRGPSIIVPEVADHDNGTYTATFTILDAGEYTLTARLDFVNGLGIVPNASPYASTTK